MPPDRLRDCPVRYEDTSEARNSAVLTMSSTLAMRPSGMVFRMASRRVSAGTPRRSDSAATRESTISLSTGPGQMLLARIPSAAYSTATDFRSMISPALLTE